MILLMTFILLTNDEHSVCVTIWKSSLHTCIVILNWSIRYPEELYVKMQMSESVQQDITFFPLPATFYNVCGVSNWAYVRIEQDGFMVFLSSRQLQAIYNLDAP